MRLLLSALAALGAGLVSAHPCVVRDIDVPNRPYAALRGCTVLNLGREPHGAERQMGDGGAFALARALATEEGREVSHVSLYGQGIGVAGAAELAEMLKTRASPRLSIAPNTAPARPALHPTARPCLPCVRRPVDRIARPVGE